MPKEKHKTENQNLQQTLVQINKNIKKLNSFKRNFALSVVRGLGFALGSTIVLGIIIALLVRISSIFFQNSQFMQRMPWQQQVQQDLQEQLQKDLQQQINTNPLYEN